MISNYSQAMHAVITAGHAITDEVGRVLKPFGISEPQYNVLRLLDEAGDEPQTIHEIQCGMVQRTSNVSRIIDKLLEKGFVNRSQCASNRRKVDITLTKTGKAELAKLDKAVRDLHTPGAQLFTEKELNQLRTLAKRMTGVYRP